MEKKYTITLADGTRIENLELNGNNFISDENLTDDTFEGNLSVVTISDGVKEKTYHNMELIQLMKDADNRIWFIINEIPSDKLERIKLQADMEYIAMMAGIKL